MKFWQAFSKKEVLKQLFFVLALFAILIPVAIWDSDTQVKISFTDTVIKAKSDKFSHLALQLETGRTHQIRVHMKYIGHPLFSDARYGGDKILRGTTSSKYQQFIQNCFSICPRQALHAKTLGFVHPITGKQMDFDSEIPQDMVELISKWRDYANAYNK